MPPKTTNPAKTTKAIAPKAPKVAKTTKPSMTRRVRPMRGGDGGSCDSPVTSTVLQTSTNVPFESAWAGTPSVPCAYSAPSSFGSASSLGDMSYTLRFPTGGDGNLAFMLPTVQSGGRRPRSPKNKAGPAKPAKKKAGPAKPAKKKAAK